MHLDVARADASPAAAACVGRILPPLPLSRRAGHWQRGLAKAAFEVLQNPVPSVHKALYHVELPRKGQGRLRLTPVFLSVLEQFLDINIKRSNKG